MTKPRSITTMLILLCVAVFALVTVGDFLGIVSRPRVIFFLGLSREGLFHRHFWHQPATATFLHLGVAHLAFNMLTLWFLGPDIERLLGKRRYAVFSAVSALCASAGVLVFSSHPMEVTAGYSGVIFGILTAQAIHFPNRQIYIYAFFPLKMKYAACLLAIIELYLLVYGQGGSVSHSAHLFGALGAAVFLKAESFRWRKQSYFYNPQAKRISKIKLPPKVKI